MRPREAWRSQEAAPLGTAREGDEGPEAPDRGKAAGGGESPERAGAVTLLDSAILLAVVLGSLLLGLSFRKRAEGGLDDYFLAGRRLPWWAVGLSLVATTFAADTPLVVTGWVREEGIARNWIWWTMSISGILTAVLFSRLWRRVRVMTHVELVEHRYGGRPAAILRAVLGAYHATCVNTIVLAWVLLAGIKVLGALYPTVPPVPLAAAAAGLALAYTLTAGLWGIVATDVVQYVLVQAGAIIAAWFAVRAAGGLGALLDGVRAAGLESHLHMLPDPGPGGWASPSSWTPTFSAFVVLLAIGPWLRESADGSGTEVQRISASRSEGDASWGALLYQICHNVLRPWPWVLVALASLVLLPEMKDGEAAYPAMLLRTIPPGWLGLIIGSIALAFLSTVDTHINLAASYFTSDLYRRFLRPELGRREGLVVSRIASAAVVLLAALLALASESIGGLFTLFIRLSAGLGPIVVLRWFWWRGNAWTELAALGASILTALALHHLPPEVLRPALEPLLGSLFDPLRGPTHEGALLCVLVASLGVAIPVTLLTPPVPLERLVVFFRTARPVGFWGPVRRAAGESPQQAQTRRGEALAALVAFLSANALIWGSLTGSGGMLFGSRVAATGGLTVALAGALVLFLASRTGSRAPRPEPG